MADFAPLHSRCGPFWFLQHALAIGGCRREVAEVRSLGMQSPLEVYSINEELGRGCAPTALACCACRRAGGACTACCAHYRVGCETVQAAVS